MMVYFYYLLCTPGLDDGFYSDTRFVQELLQRGRTQHKAQSHNNLRQQLGA